jgi:uncharacterized membrane protein
VNGVMPSVAAVTALGSGVLGGVFFGFSTLVMPALHRLSTPDAVTAMQRINQVAPASLLMLPLVTSAAGSLVVGAWALTGAGAPGRGWLLAGAGAGLACFVVTAAYHVPRNDALATWDPRAAATADLWATYLREWTAMNHVRGALGLAAAVATTVGLAQGWRA